jgi:hypothetical protein
LVFKGGMKLLEFAQGDKAGSLVSYVQNFNWMIIVVFLKEEYVKKLIFLHGLKL